MAVKVTKVEVEKHAAWLRSYAKKKPIKNHGGNFWGINSRRCTIIPPDMIDALVKYGHAERSGNSFVMTEKEAAK